MMQKMPLAAKGQERKMLTRVVIDTLSETNSYAVEPFEIQLAMYNEEGERKKKPNDKQNPAKVLLDFCRTMLTPKVLDRIFPDLVRLIPNDDKRKEVLVQMLDMRAKRTIEHVRLNAPGLTVVDFTGLKLNDNHVILLAQTLGRNKQEGRRHLVKALILESCRLSDSHARWIAMLIENNSTITDLQIGRNNISTAGALSIAASIERNQTMTNVSFYDNKFGNTVRRDIAIQALAKAMEANATILELDIGRNDIGSNGAKAIANLIQKFSEQQAEKKIKLAEQKKNVRYWEDEAEKRKVVMDRCQIHLSKAVPSQMQTLGEKYDTALEKHTHAAERYSFFSDRLERGLPEEEVHYKWAFQKPSADIDLKIRRLLLQRNKVGDAGAEALGQALAVNGTLTEVNLGYNEISDTGAASIAEALMSPKCRITVLNLGANSIGVVGSQALAAALGGAAANLAAKEAEEEEQKARERQKGRKQKRLGGGHGHGGLVTRKTVKSQKEADETKVLEEQGRQDEARKRRAKLFQCPLKRLFLGANTIGSDGCSAIAAALHFNSVLEQLNLYNNKIEAAGAAALGDGLLVNGTLSKLVLSNNNIADDGVAALSASIATNTSLTHLELEGCGIGAVGADALAQSLYKNRSVSDLKLGWNRMGSEGAQALAQLCKVTAPRAVRDLHQRSTIEIINLGGKNSRPQEPTGPEWTNGSPWMECLRKHTDLQQWRGD
jgi:Ran GTPase-activating protein (RanGAP) involved in mRNA processing and transport